MRYFKHKANFLIFWCLYQLLFDLETLMTKEAKTERQTNIKLYRLLKYYAEMICLTFVSLHDSAVCNCCVHCEDWPESEQRVSQ